MTKLTRLAFALGLPLLLAGCGGLPKHLTTTTRVAEPPAGKALVNFHRPSGYGGGALYPIFDGAGTFLCDLPGASEFQHVCDPGEQIFIGWAEQVAVVKADLAADKIYDIVVDVGMGWVQANIRLHPLTKNDARRSEIPSFEKREKRILQQIRDAHVVEYEQRNQARVEEIKSDFLGGGKSDRLLTLAADDCR